MRNVLFCPIGQIDGTLETVEKNLKTVKSTDTGRYTKFLHSWGEEFEYVAGKKIFVRRFRLFSQSMAYGAKLLNLGQNGLGADAFEIRFGVTSNSPPYGFPFPENFFAPALNEWNDIHFLYAGNPLFQMQENGNLNATYCVSIDRSSISDSLAARNIPDDLQIQLEVDF